MQNPKVMDKLSAIGIELDNSMTKGTSCVKYLMFISYQFKIGYFNFQELITPSSLCDSSSRVCTYNTGLISEFDPAYSTLQLSLETK